jgi:uncharacterized protein (DUF433 family)
VRRRPKILDNGNIDAKLSPFEEIIMVNTLFTTAEAASLAQAPAGAIEKAIEEGIIEVRRPRASKARTRARRLLSAEGIFYVAFLKTCELQFSKAHKRQIWTLLAATPPKRLLTTRWRIAPGIDIKPGELLRAVHERVAWYARARERWIESSLDIMGGTPVIRGTRMTVYAVAGRVAHGETVEDIVADNPDLPREAIEAALAFARGNPPIGRPGTRPWRALRREVLH